MNNNVCVQEVLEPPPVMPGTTYQLTLAFPDFSRHKVADLFRPLGPVAVFSAKHHWTAPRAIQLRKKEEEGYGFSVRGDAPVVIAGVEQNSLADIGGMREGDYLVGIGDRDIKWASHAEVVQEIKAAENNLKLRLVTPLDRSMAKLHFKEKVSNEYPPALQYIAGQQTREKLRNPLQISVKSSKSVVGGSVSPSSTTSSSSGLSGPLHNYSLEEPGFSPASSESSGSTRQPAGGGKKHSWGIFKASRERRNSRDNLFDDNIIFR